MDAKEFLGQIEMLDTMIENKRAEVQRWKDIANNTGSNMSLDHAHSSGSKDTFQNAICTYMDIEREEIAPLLARRKDIISVIEKLSADEYDLLYKIYVQYLSLKEIIFKKKRSYSWATTTHKKALSNLQKILDEREEISKNGNSQKV